MPDETFTPVDETFTPGETIEEFQKTDQYQIRKQANQVLSALKGKIPAHLNLDDVKFSYNLGGERTLGQVSYRFNRMTNVCHEFQVKYNLAFKATSIPQPTLIHEIAHVLAMKWKGYSESGHGFYWGYICIALGQEPSRLAEPTESAEFSKAKKISRSEPFLFDMCKTCGHETMSELSGTEYICEECHTITKRI